MSEHPFDAYRIEMRLDGNSCVAWLAEIPQILVEAGSPGHAVGLLREGFEVWVQEMADLGRDLQAPWGDAELSGRVLLRMPSFLHTRLAAEAVHQGVSLNALLNVILAEAVGFARGERVGAHVPGRHPTERGVAAG
ncbi:toxin-antitoxin system HicB family antitoxin [bacterium]|nr:toxin-antitoxin system HicB family antitoxin [bacterium]